MRFIKEVAMIPIITIVHCVAVIILYRVMDRRLKEIEKRIYPCREEDNCCKKDEKDI
jgi:hypothetical protein